MTDCMHSLSVFAVTVTILTQSAEYVELGMNDGVTAISWPDNVDILDIQTVTSGCLVASSFTWYGLTLALPLML